MQQVNSQVEDRFKIQKQDGSDRGFNTVRQSRDASPIVNNVA